MTLTFSQISQGTAGGGGGGSQAQSQSQQTVVEGSQSEDEDVGFGAAGFGAAAHYHDGSNGAFPAYGVGAGVVGGMGSPFKMGAQPHANWSSPSADPLAMSTPARSLPGPSIQAGALAHQGAPGAGPHTGFDPAHAGAGTDDEEEEEDGLEYSTDHDEIDLLYSKRRSLAARRHPHSPLAKAALALAGRAPGSGVRSGLAGAGAGDPAARPRPRAPQQRKAPAHRLAEALEELFEADDSTPTLDEVRAIEAADAAAAQAESEAADAGAEGQGEAVASSSGDEVPLAHAQAHAYAHASRPPQPAARAPPPAKRWSNAYFEHVAVAAGQDRIVLRARPLAALLALVRASASASVPALQASAQDTPAPATAQSAPRTLADLPREHRARLARILARTAAAADGIQPAPTSGAASGAGAGDAASPRAKADAAAATAAGRKRKRTASKSPPKKRGKKGAAAAAVARDDEMDDDEDADADADEQADELDAEPEPEADADADQDPAPLPNSEEAAARDASADSALHVDSSPEKGKARGGKAAAAAKGKGKAKAKAGAGKAGAAADDPAAAHAAMLEARRAFVQASAVLARGCLAAECMLALMAADAEAASSGSAGDGVGDARASPGIGAAASTAALISEDALQAALEPLKACVQGVVVPFIEAAPDSVGAAFFDAIAADVRPKKAVSKKKKGKAAAAQQLQEEAQAAAASALDAVQADALSSASECVAAAKEAYDHAQAALTAVQRLCVSEAVPLSDGVAITLVYLALKPFFLAEPSAAAAAGTAGGAAASRASSISPNKAGVGAAAGAAGKGRASAYSHLDPLGGPSAAAGKLRRPCLSILRFIFRTQAPQRTWIVEEILSSLIRLPDLKNARRQHRLANGAAVHPVNALLLQLIQSAADVRPAPAPAARSASLAPGLATSARIIAAEGEDADEEEDDGDADMLGPDGRSMSAGSASRSRTAVAFSLDGSISATQAVTSYLVHKLQNHGKVIKSSTDMSYVVIIENLVTDLSAMLYSVDWPAAALLLTRLSAAFAALLEDKASADAKGVAIDQLGVVAAALRRAQLSMVDHALPLARISMHNTNAEDLRKIVDGYVEVIQHLDTQQSGDVHAIEAATDYWQAQALGDLTAFIAHLEDKAEEGVASTATHTLCEIAQEGKEKIVSLYGAAQWQRATFRAKSETSDDGKAPIPRIAEMLTLTSAGFLSFDFIKKRLLRCVDEQAVGNRAKALRAIGAISQVDADLLEDEQVRDMVETRLADSSPGVRDTAVNLLGKYLLRKQKCISQHFQQLLNRLHDSSLAVRKRVTKLLTGFYDVLEDDELRVELCVHIIRCVLDEDSGLQQLALSAVGSIWFGQASIQDADAKPVVAAATATVAGPSIVKPEKPAGGASSSRTVSTSSVASESEAGVDDLARHSTIIMRVCGQLKERPSPLEEVFKRIGQASSNDPAQGPSVHRKFKGLLEKLIDNLVTEQVTEPQDLMNCIKAIHTIVSTHPTTLSVSKTKALLPYLKSAQTPEELQIMELLLRTFHVRLPSLPRSALIFAEQLQRTLVSMVSKPPNVPPTSPLMQELIGCFCTTIKVLTHDYKILVRTLDACASRMVRVMERAINEPASKPDRSSALVITMTTLLCENADYDSIREQAPEFSADLDRFSKGSILDTMYEMLLRLRKAESDAWQLIALQNLGMLLRSYAGLWTLDSTVRLMDSIFAGTQARHKELLLRIMSEYLTREDEKRAAEMRALAEQAARSARKGIDMGQLVGNTETFNDSSISTQLIQHNLQPVLAGALSVDTPVTQRISLDILKHTVMRGLSHPLQCLPTLIALETSHDPRISAKALHMHSHLASKHGSILAVRYLDHARAAFDYQRAQHPEFGKLRGHRDPEDPRALLQPWYDLIRDRRQPRLDFIKAMIKAFDVDAGSNIGSRDVLFARFIADTLATLEYKGQEEILLAIHELKTVISVGGMQALFNAERAAGHRRAPVSLLDSLPLEVVAQTPSPEGSEASFDDSPGKVSKRFAPHLESNSAEGQTEEADLHTSARVALVMSLALALRNHLKWLYNMSEAKCLRFVPGKKNSAGGDKPAVQRPMTDRSWVSLDLRELPHVLVQDPNDEQCYEILEAYIDIMANEGTQIEPADGLGLD